MCDIDTTLSKFSVIRSNYKIVPISFLWLLRGNQLSCADVAFETYTKIKSPNGQPHNVHLATAPCSSYYFHDIITFPSITPPTDLLLCVPPATYFPNSIIPARLFILWYFWYVFESSLWSQIRINCSFSLLFSYSSFSIFQLCFKETHIYPHKSFYLQIALEAVFIFNLMFYHNFCNRFICPPSLNFNMLLLLMSTIIFGSLIFLAA